MLTKGLDSGPMLYHALPRLGDDTPFEFTMRAVEAAQQSLVERIANGNIQGFTPQIQDKGREIRYTKNADFTDDVASDFLFRSMNNGMLHERLSTATPPQLLHPFYA